MAQPDLPLSSFRKFPDLPAEIRLKIWAQACNRPRNFGLWSDFQKCEVENTIFYTQLYESKLSTITPSPILQTSRESRAEALKYFTLDFMTHQPMKIRASNRSMIVSHPGFYVNFRSETLCPRGNWNIISMEDFILRRAPSQLRSLAIDVTTDFYKEFFKEYIMKSGWPFEVMEEVILYDGTGLGIFKKDYSGGKVEFDFVDVEAPTSILESGKEKLHGIFAKMEGKNRVQAEKNEAERGTSGISENISAFRQPKVKIRELMVRSSPETDIPDERQIKHD